MPGDPPDLRSVLQRAAAHVLLHVDRAAPPPGEPPEPAVVGNDRWEVRVVVSSRLAAGNEGGGSRLAAGPKLTGLDREILGAATAAVQTVGQLSDACDRGDTDSYFRGRVRRLKRLGLLVPEGEGYRLP